MNPSFPQLEVRPLVDPREIEFLKGKKGYRPAATITFGETRQSMRALTREFDKAKRRQEDWERKCSAEPIFIGSFPAYSSLATKPFPLIGAFPPGQEVRDLQVVVEGTLKINAATGQIQAADHNVIALAIFKRIRASLFGVADCYSLTPPQSRSIAFVAESRDVSVQDPNLRIGTGLTTTPIAFKLKFKIPFVMRALEMPEIFSPCTDQLNLANTVINLETQGDALTTIALVSGASTVVINDVKLYVVCNQVPGIHGGPPHQWREKDIAQNVDTETGQACDLFAGFEEAATATGSGARLGQVTVRRDGRQQPLSIDPVTLAQQFNEANYSVDGIAALDITTGQIPFGGLATAAQPVPHGNIGTQVGAQLVPVIFMDGRIRAGAWQWPFWMNNRQIVQTPLSGQSSAIKLLYWQVRPIYECAGQIVSMALANNLQISSLDDLQVRAGYDGEANKTFKGRYMRRKPLPTRALTGGAA